MTDTDAIAKIAVTLKVRGWKAFTAEHIDECLAETSAHYVEGSHIDLVKRLAALVDEIRCAEREECIAICRAMTFENLTPEEEDGLDGLDRVDYYDSACARIERAIRARGAK